MVSLLPASRRLLTCLASLTLALGVSTACGDDGAPAGEGGGGSTGTGTPTGGDTAATTGSSSGEGGATTTSSGEGGSTTTGTGAGGGESTCDGAVAGASCEVEGVACEELTGQGVCDEGLPRITSCTGGRWEVWTAISCDAFVADPSCAIPGRYLIEPSGPFAPEGDWLADDHGQPFEVSFEVRDDERLYASAERGWIEPGTCELRAGWTLDESCEDVDGESFCTTIDRTLELTMDTDPATGTVELECWGECGSIVTAPVTATRL